MTQTLGSTVIDAPIARVWAIIRDFTSTPKWFAPAISCRMEDDAPVDRVGAVKLVGLPGGASVREELLGLSDLDHVLTYRILAKTDAGPATGAYGAVARVAMRRVTDTDATYIEWSHEYEVEAGDPAAVRAFYEGLYPMLFEGLRGHAMDLGDG